MKRNYKVICFLFAHMLMVSTGMASTCKQCVENPSDLDVMAFSYKAMMAIHYYNYVNYPQILTAKNASQYFTKPVWDNYYQQLESQGMLEKVRKNKYISSIGTENTPQIIQKISQNGKTTEMWQIQIPALIIYQSQTDLKKDKKVITLSIIQDKDHCLKVNNMLVK